LTKFPELPFVLVIILFVLGSLVYGNFWGYGQSEEGFSSLRPGVRDSGGGVIEAMRSPVPEVGRAGLLPNDRVHAVYSGPNLDEEEIDELLDLGINTFVIKMKNVFYTNYFYATTDDLPEKLKMYSRLSKEKDFRFFPMINFVHRVEGENDGGTVDSIITNNRVVYSDGKTGDHVTLFDEAYWDQLTEMGKRLIELNDEADSRVDGMVIDFELYKNENYGEPRKFNGLWGFESSTFDRYILDRDLGIPTLANPPAGKADTYNWLEIEGKLEDYYLYLKEDITRISEEMNSELDVLNDGFLVGVTPTPSKETDINNPGAGKWYLANIMDGLSSVSDPMIFFGTETTYELDGLPRLKLRTDRTVGGYFDLSNFYRDCLDTPYGYFVGILGLKEYSPNNLAYSLEYISTESNGYWIYSADSFNEPIEVIRTDSPNRVLDCFDEENGILYECEDYEYETKIVEHVFEEIEIANEEIDKFIADPNYVSYLREMNVVSKSCNAVDTLVCGSEVGLCSKGVRNCVDLKWGICEGDTEPAHEVCDDEDNNCDGETDVGCSCVDGSTKPCGKDDGECSFGEQTCVNEVWGDCVGGQVPVDEICDGLDNDCNGNPDDGGNLLCEDGIACTENVCNGAHGCANTEVHSVCDNGEFCDGGEVCSIAAEGCEIINVPVIDDGIPCTFDECDEDNDEVTNDPRDSECLDGDFCNGAESCSATLGCVDGAIPTCNDDVSCTVDSCSEGTPGDNAGTCENDPAGCSCDEDSDCNDDNPCTDDVCNDQKLCDNDGDDTNTCDDDLFCTVNDRCESKVCVGDDMDVDDGISCTRDRCDEDNDIPRHLPVNDLCNDAHECTDNFCHYTEGCKFVERDTKCDDGVYCNGVETCSATLGCVDGDTVECGDSFSCTDDTCDETSESCLNTKNDLSCTGDETCDPVNFVGPSGCGLAPGCNDIDGDGMDEFDLVECVHGRDICSGTNQSFFNNNHSAVGYYSPKHGTLVAPNATLGNILKFINFSILNESSGFIMFKENVSLVGVNDSVFLI